MKAVVRIALLALAVATGITLTEGKVMAQVTSAANRLPVEGHFPSLDGALGWLNTSPLTPGDLRGKVVLVNFWTYSCINWLRTEPYVRAWAEKYKDHGLVVIGAHTPEFSFEKNVDNVRWALKNFRIDYPVAIDSDYKIWRAFDNRYWPALYFIDAEGNIRHHHFGEGDYERSESVIQDLLTEAGYSGFDRSLVSVEGTGLEAPADWDDIATPETYVGFGRGENFASSPGAVRDAPTLYAAPERLLRNQWSLSGTWSIGREAAMLKGANGRLAFRFRARDLHLVLGPTVAGTPVRFRVAIDGQVPGKNHGDDIGADGVGNVVEQRLYQLIRQDQAIEDRTFEIEFLDAGVDVFVFTFG